MKENTHKKAYHGFTRITVKVDGEVNIQKPLKLIDPPATSL